MATPEDVIRDLKEKNSELVQKVQYWKMTAAQRENEKLELMKEINELRLKLSRLRSGGAAQARKLDAALQSASEEALSHLVQASGAVARTIELAKTYMRDRQELDAASPRWSNISGTPSTERVHRVPPMMIGGQSIQPVVSLSRAVLNTSNPRSVSRSPNQNRSLTERAVPMHMLQDVYIPLTRIDATDFASNNAQNGANNGNDSTEDLRLDDSIDRSLEESQNITEEDFEASRRLDAVTEDLEPEDEVITPPRRVDNPLEGPSWLLDGPSNKPSPSRRTLEPDSTSELGPAPPAPTPPPPPRLPRPAHEPHNDPEKENTPLSLAAGCEFSPTVRRRKRTATPGGSSGGTSRGTPPPDLGSPDHFSPRHRTGSTGRVLKVLVAKMRLEEGGSPPKRGRCRQAPFDAPSPNGSTDAAVIVSSEELDNTFGAGDACDSRGLSRDNVARASCDKSRDDVARVNCDPSRDAVARGSCDPSHDNVARGSCDQSRDNHSVTSRDSHDSDADSATEGRTRRQRKPITYKEKPLNRKMRR